MAGHHIHNTMDGQSRHNSVGLSFTLYTPNVTHVVNTMINDAGTELLTSLHSRYLTHLKVDDSSYPARSLCEKLLKTFPDSLQTTKKSNKAGIIVFNVILSEESAIRKATFDEHYVKETASYIRMPPPPGKF